MQAYILIHSKQVVLRQEFVKPIDENGANGFVRHIATKYNVCYTNINNQRKAYL